MKNMIKYGLGVAALLVLNAGPAWAAGSVKTTSDVVLASDGMTVVGSSTLVRTSKGISMSIHTTGIPAGHAVTVWFCIYRDPLDPFSGPFDCVRAAGHVVGTDGKLNLAGWVGVGDGSESISPAFGADGRGLLDPYVEFVELAVRDHGPAVPAVPGKIPDQIHSFQPGCATCSDPQYSDHPAP